MRTLGLLVVVLAAACGGGGGGSSAQLTVVTPTQNMTVVQGTPVTIRFTANDGDEQATVRVVVDRDGNPDTVIDQTVIATLVENNGAELVHVWQTASVQPGQYTIFLVLLEANKPPNQRVVAVVDVVQAPTLNVGPLDRTVIAGSDVTIAFNASDPAGIATYAVYADLDCNFNTTPDRIVIAGNLTAAQSVVVWDTSAVPIDTYCIFITMDDGTSPVTVRSAGTIGFASDADLIFAPDPAVPFVPDVSILTLDPNSPDFYQLLWFDDLDDIPAGEMDISVSFTGQEGDILWFAFELYSTVTQDILRDDMFYVMVLEEVRWNGVTGTLVLSNDGAFPDFGLALFDDGVSAEFIDVPVYVFADPTVPADDFAYLFFGVPAEYFAFPTFTEDRSDFLIVAALARLDGAFDVIPETIDDTEFVVIRYVNGP